MAPKYALIFKLHNFSLLFLYTGSDPVTVALLPIALFAILHSASYSLTLLDTIGKHFHLLKVIHVGARGKFRPPPFSSGTNNSYCIFIQGVTTETGGWAAS